MPDTRTQETVTYLKGLPKDELIPAFEEAMQGRPQEEKKEIAETVIATANGGLPPPDAATRDKLWTIVVSAFAFVLVGGFIALAVGVFIRIPKEGVNLVKPELILATFTTVVGFLAGLFTPSPVAKPANGGTE